MAANLGPGQNDLCASGLVLLGNLEDDRVVDEQGLAKPVVTCWVHRLISGIDS